MSYTIRLTPPELRQKAANIDNNAATVQREVNSITQIVSRLRSTFLGETAAVFFKEFDTARQNMEQWDDIVKSFATEIREAANKLEAADRGHH
ncbi:MAG: WXG100 family type VII secretion target [Anaerolineales bacterium]|nr:WXG100 family type VII secretion target [Anaerolineales bacterium]